ncbi:MAG TPA: hypothetical protein VL119_15385, partial [Acidimicrobiia bacterium]|nr:hypothetical protein [Acidimicrobiia bacterium]
AGVPLLIAWRRPGASILAFGMSFVAVLLLSTATGGRYLVWAIAAAFLIDVRAAVVYNIAASTLLLVVYDRWAGGFPWNIAHGSPWTHNETVLAGIAWLALLAVAVMGLWNQRKEPRLGDDSSDQSDGGEPDRAPPDEVRLVTGEVH